MRLLGGKWKASILWHLKARPLRFNALSRELGGASKKMIAERLKEMEEIGLVRREIISTKPVAVSWLAHSLSAPEIDGEFTGSIGLPIPSTEAMIAGDDGNELEVGEVGEICLKGPQVMEGYWQRPAETAEVMLPGGWLRTGDVGRMDEHGFIYIEDRKKDMILVSGFNVYPNEIEEVAVSHDGVLEAAAVGLPDEKSGEVVKLFVVRKDPALDEAKLKAYFKENLTGYKVPRVIEFRDELPKSNVGKILRRELRDEATG